MEKKVIPHLRFKNYKSVIFTQNSIVFNEAKIHNYTNFYEPILYKQII